MRRRTALSSLAAGFVLASLLSRSVLAQFYVDPEQARTIVVANTGLIGAAIGAMVLAAFRRSVRVHKDVAGVSPTPSILAVPKFARLSLLAKLEGRLARMRHKAWAGIGMLTLGSLKVDTFVSGRRFPCAT